MLKNLSLCLTLTHLLQKSLKLNKNSIASGLQKSILKTTAYQRLLDLKTLVKKGTPNKIQIMQKSFMDSTKKSK